MPEGGVADPGRPSGLRGHGGGWPFVHRASTGEYQPHIPQLADLIVEDTTPAVLDGHDVIVLALPHGASGALAAQLDDDAVVVDLGADIDLSGSRRGTTIMGRFLPALDIWHA